MAYEEEVLVVPRHQIFVHGPFHGFRRDPLSAYHHAIRNHSTFAPRSDVEHDPMFKQIIPYLVVRHHHQIFLFQRSSEGGEARLAGRYSIGLGGHINRRDVEGTKDVIWAGLRRELEEELVIEGEWTASPLGVLNDDVEPVGRVHFGLVYLIDVSTAKVFVKEVDRLEGGFVPIGELEGYREGMESWSRLILEGVDLREVRSERRSHQWTQ